MDAHRRNKASARVATETRRQPDCRNSVLAQCSSCADIEFSIAVQTQEGSNVGMKVAPLDRVQRPDVFHQVVAKSTTALEHDADEVIDTL